MQHVKKGEKIRASTINQIIDKLENNKSENRASNKFMLHPVVPDAYALTSKSVMTTVRGKIKKQLSYIEVTNNCYFNGSSIATFDTKTYRTTEVNLDEISSLYLIYSYGEYEILSNKEIEQRSTEEQSSMKKYKLYDLEVSKSTGKCEILKDYRKLIAPGVTTTTSSYGAFQWQLGRSSESGFSGELIYCNFQFGRSVYTIEDGSQTIASTSGLTLYLIIDHENPSSSTISYLAEDTTLTQTCLPLIQLDKYGKIINDYRGMPTIPVWSTSTT